MKYLKKYELFDTSLKGLKNSQKIQIELDMDDEDDCLYVIYNDDSIGIEDFINILNEELGLSIEYTFDDSFYDQWESTLYQKTINKLENKYGELDWEHVEPIYFAYAQESLEWFNDKFESLEYVYISVKYRFLSSISSRESVEKLENTLMNEKYWDNYDKIKKEVENRLTKLGYDYDEFYKTLKNNFDTNGSASRRLLGEEGLLNEWILEDFDIKRYTSERQEIEQLINSMIIARKRHLETDYDSIDKSKMSDEDVKILRKHYNN